MIKPISLATLLLASLMALQGCGGDSSDNTTTTPTTETATDDSAAAPVMIPLMNQRLATTLTMTPQARMVQRTTRQMTAQIAPQSQRLRVMKTVLHKLTHLSVPPKCLSTPFQKANRPACFTTGITPILKERFGRICPLAMFNATACVLANSVTLPILR